MEQTTHQQLTDYIVAHQEDFYRLAYSYVKNRDAALDVVQESIVKALSKSDSLRKPEFLKTWFYRILLNESMNYYRHNRRLVSLEEEGLPETAAPQGDHAARLDLYAAIDRLDSREQALVDKLDAVADAYVQEVEGLLGSSGGTGTASSVFSVVTVKAGQQLLHQGLGPLLQGLGHDGVVGIGHAALDYVPGLVPTQLVFVHKYAH